MIPHRKRVPARPSDFQLARRLGRNLKKLREQAAWTQEYLAEKAGVTPRYVQTIEAGVRLPSLTIAESLRRALKTSWGNLLD